MGDVERHRLESRVSGKAGVLAARSLIGDIAGRIPDPHRAREVEAELRDAWLRLQFALHSDDIALARAELEACERILREARSGDTRPS